MRIGTRVAAHGAWKGLFFLHVMPFERFDLWAFFVNFQSRLYSETVPALLDLEDPQIKEEQGKRVK